MWGEALTLIPCTTPSLAVTSSTSLKGHKCFLFSIHAPYVQSVRILTKWANSSSRGKGKKKGLTELPEKHWGLGKQWHALLCFRDSWHPPNPRHSPHNKTPLLLFDKSQQCLQIDSGSFGTQALRQLDQHGHLSCQREREESRLGKGETI